MTQFVVLLTEADWFANAFRHTSRIMTFASAKRVSMETARNPV
jgi:hypothetical protein